MASEFELIERLFGPSVCEPGQGWPAGALAGGDDAALLASLPPSHQPVWAIDTMVEHRHFWPDAAADAVGEKLLAVNLSDLAAMGAEPLGCLLSLGVPGWNNPDAQSWLARFSRGLLAAAHRHGCPLYGGDTVAIPQGSAKVLSITVLGHVPQGKALRRDAAQPGDDIWVSGCLGDAAAALAMHQPHPRLDRPTPRLALGLALRQRGLSNAAIDLSDGLAGDLAHIVRASRRHHPGLQAEIQLAQVWQATGPLLREHVGHGTPALQQAGALLACTGGDDYELCFAASPKSRTELERLSVELDLPLHCVGRLELASANEAIAWLGLDGQRLSATLAPQAGFDHGEADHA